MQMQMQVEQMLQSIVVSPLRSYFGVPAQCETYNQQQEPKPETQINRDELVELFRDKLRSDTYISA